MEFASSNAFESRPRLRWQCNAGGGGDIVVDRLDWFDGAMLMVLFSYTRKLSAPAISEHRRNVEPANAWTVVVLVDDVVWPILHMWK
jgi:hypothetical protein